jgi:Zn-dependent metalloprotease
MGEMHDAAGLLGNTLGGLPVGMVEGAVGAKIGSSLVGRAMATKTAMPLVEWKANQYAKLDMHIDNGVAGMRNLAFTKFGIGGPVMRANSVNGIVPGYMLEELARRDPGNPAYPETIQKLNALANNRGQFGERAAAIDHKGAREVYDAQFKEQPGKLVRSEGGKKTGDPEVDNIYDYTGEVRAFYSEVHGRNSVDGKGMKMKSTVNYGDNFENAYWDGTGMYYGKPGPQSPFSNFTKRDITGHEITHGVTEHVSNIVYRGQPGALNESISDVFGALVVQKVLGQTAKEATWLVGEGIWKPEMNSKALRDMRNPGTAYDHPTIGKDPQPAHMNDFIRTRSDNGGVHLNSGIPNRAFVLAADAIGGFAWEAPGKIWYQARANAGSQPSFAQFAHHTIEAAKQLGYEQHVPKLQKAWNDVGITPSAIDKGGLTPVMPDNGFERKTTIGSH